MRIARFCVSLMVLAALSCAEAARAEWWAPTTWWSSKPADKPKAAPATKPFKPAAVAPTNGDNRSFLTKMGDALTLKKSPAQTKTVTTHYGMVSDAKAKPQAPPAQSKPSTWSSWFTKKEEPKPPQSLNDWMSMKRPQP